MSDKIPTVLISLVDGREISLPQKATPGASGYDICAREKVVIDAGSFAKVPTGMKISVPVGYEAQVRPRSGLAAKHGVTVLNAPGTIDSDYRGEVCVILINHGKERFEVESGMRIAQLVFGRTEEVWFKEVKALDESKRGEGGFGSTGK